MCAWCPETNTPEERERLRMAAESIANSFAAMERHYRNISHGRSPHSGVEGLPLAARAILREMVEWL